LTLFFFHSENDLLKHQLRKYVSAVQLMKQDENESEEAKLYQQKLIQVCNYFYYLHQLNSHYINLKLLNN